jgi:hypothetical protein
MSDLTRADFVLRLRKLGVKQASFAERVQLHPVTVYQWGTYAEFPPWVDLLLTAWERVAELEGRGSGNA